MSHTLESRLDGKNGQWVMKLGSYGLAYESTTMIKYQVFADFIVEYSVQLQVKAKKEVHE